MENKEKCKPTGNYPVGYAAPPKNYQFTKGKSGNPKGRPKAQKAISEESLFDLLTKPIRVKRGSKQLKVSPFEAKITAIINKALTQAHLGSIAYILKLAKKHGLLPSPAVQVAGGVVTLPRVVGGPQDMAMMLAHRFGVDENGWLPEEIEIVRPDYERQKKLDEENLRNRIREELRGKL